MLTDEAAVKLHHRASLGEKLSPEEGAALEAWYAKQDAEEMAALAAAPLSQDVRAIQERIKALLARLVRVTGRIHALAVENERLYSEVRILREQLANGEEFDIRAAYPLMDAVARAEGWDDPEMDSYNIYARKPQQ
jgi:hypothetical protein